MECEKALSALPFDPEALLVSKAINANQEFKYIFLMQCKISPQDMVMKGQP